MGGGQWSDDIFGDEPSKGGADPPRFDWWLRYTWPVALVAIWLSAGWWGQNWWWLGAAAWIFVGWAIPYQLDKIEYKALHRDARKPGHPER